MRRFFINPCDISGNTCTITGTDVHHITHVLKKKEGDSIMATNGEGNYLFTVISHIENDKITLTINEVERVQETNINLRLFQALPKGGKIDQIIEKACELGASEVIPIITERTIPKIDEAKGLKRIARWERIVLETMKQIGRNSMMNVHHAIPIDEMETLLKSNSLKILLWESEENKTLKELLTEYQRSRSIEILVGPEGGFSIAEAERFQAMGFKSVSMGKRILKTETAAIVAMANIFYELNS